MELAQFARERLRKSPRRISKQLAAECSGAISELQVLLGRLEEAVEAGEQSVKEAGFVDDPKLVVYNLCVKADSLHESGRYELAEETFINAEELVKKCCDPKASLQSIPAFRYAAFLLGHGRCREVLDRMKTLQTAGPLDEALKDLFVGRALLREARTDQAKQYLDQAVHKLYRIDIHEALILSLRERAHVQTMQGQLDKAMRTLQRAIFMSRRAGMILYEASCRLLAVEIHRRQGHSESAAEAFARADLLVKRARYVRRYEELDRLRAELDGDSNAV